MKIKKSKKNSELTGDRRDEKCGKQRGGGRSEGRVGEEKRKERLWRTELETIRRELIL